MRKLSDDFSMQDAYRLAQSDAGQRLIALLQSQNSDTVERAMEQMAAGDPAQAKQTLSTLLSSPQIRAMLEQLGRDTNG